MLNSKVNTGELRSAFRFAIVGVAVTMVHLFTAQLSLFYGVLSAFSSNFLGFIVAFFAGFVGHYYFTFEGTSHFRTSLLRYGVIACTGFFANNSVLFWLVSSEILSEQSALAVAILLIPVATFAAARLWGFAKGAKQES